MVRLFRMEFGGGVCQLGAGLRQLKLEGRELSALPKVHHDKQVLAWRVYRRTTVKRHWLAERLAMGYETRISQAVTEMESSRKPGFLTLKRKLMECVV